MTGTTTTLAAENVLRLNLGWLDYVLVAIYFVFVLGIGFIARSQISTSLDFFLSGRRLPALDTVRDRWAALVDQGLGDRDVAAARHGLG